MQLGFDMAFADPHTGDVVPWADATSALLSTIRRARWKICDIETTGLNPASSELDFSGKDLRRGVDPTLRVRVISVLFRTETGIHVKGFDLDRLSPSQKRALAEAVLDGVFINHNAGFDLYWLRDIAKRKVLPKKVLDSMLIARALYPQQPLMLAKMVNDEEEDYQFRQVATEAFQKSRSGWSLADLALTVLRKLVDKAKQGPRNWAQPFLTTAEYNYATGDVITTYELLCALLGVQYGDDILEAYEALLLTGEQDSDPEVVRAVQTLKLQEPQVLDVGFMRENGMPWSAEKAEAYVAEQWKKVAQLAEEMIKLEPELAKFRSALANAEAGVSRELKLAIGECFRRRGLVLETTEKTADPKIGEKDLRKAQAAINKDAAPLFEVWTSLQRAKKAGGMSREFTEYAKRSGDGRIHSNIGHGPATGRLSSSEPNVQQAPRDQGFRNAVAAPPGYKIVASDYSALDMRVGSALAIRAQRQIREAFEGKRTVENDVALAIRRVYRNELQLAQCRRMEEQAEKAFNDWKLKREEILGPYDPENGANKRKAYWDKYRKLGREALISRFRRCLSEVQERAKKAGTPEWGSLRDAFSIPGMDIHTWTALAMNGQDPVSIFVGKPNDIVVKELKNQKKILGPKRQGGKVGNLSLTYAMKDRGFQDSAASIHNIHWTLEEAGQIRVKWLASYVEMDLWHCWTELNPHSFVYVPDPDKGGKPVRKPVFGSRTLSGRLIYAFGLNAGLAYEDQSTGADILGTAMDRFHREFPEVFACLVNQVHDECVFLIPDEKVQEYTEIITRVMVEAAEKFLMVYGVHAEVSPAIGDVWIKD